MQGYVPELNTPAAREYMIESYRNEERDRERLNDAKDIQKEIEKTMMDEILNEEE
jgi:hypothetical protein